MTDHDAAEQAEFAKAVGSGRQFAERVRLERQRRGWSQAELSRQMRTVGHPLDQAAISKIESPPESDRFRRIDIDEAIGFSKVFDLSLEQMTLPMLKARELDVLRVMAAGAGLARAEHEAIADYERVVRIVALAAEVFPAVASRFEERLAAAVRGDQWEQQFLQDVSAWRTDSRNGLAEYKRRNADLEEEVAIELSRWESLVGPRTWGDVGND